MEQQTEVIDGCAGWAIGVMSKAYCIESPALAKLFFNNEAICISVIY